MLHDLFSLAARYGDYKLVNDMRNERDLSKHVPNSWKRTDLRLRPHLISRSDSTPVFKVFEKVKNTCSLNDVFEHIAVQCFPELVKRDAESLLLGRIAGRSGIAEFRRLKMLQTYRNVANDLLQNYLTD